MAQFSEQTDQQTDLFPLTQAKKTGKSGLDTNQKKVLGITAAAMLLGGAAWAVAQKIENRKTGGTASSDEPSTPTSPSIDLPVDIDVAGKVTDDMPFDQAFTTARAEVGLGGVFGWHGRWYNTFEKEEWDGLSLEQRQEYTEMVTGEKLPVKAYRPASTVLSASQLVTSETEPTVIEGYLNGQRVMGLDFDQDGIIDTLVLDGADGKTYRVVDATGNDGLDTVYQYDSLDGELTGLVRLDEPVVLTNDDFGQYLENTMSREVVDSILEPDASAPETAPDAVEVSENTAADDETGFVADAYLPDDDTYVNDGDVHDMNE
ncbi:hypothetical protein [Larkinella rosea]|uniref:Uncharacterized protein n=1 Tax=Larkinella rosea TaxID=2025312 RepID=A0A3P1BTN3_9BACT|nr:hypothetical protein [Larkinella rosea]RRB04417.1 hypothetical protein EHT25_13025 [Larkinella rosea]